MIYDYLLNIFCGSDELRPKMKRPNLREGYVYATDGHAIIKVPERLVALKYDSDEKYPNAESVIDTHRKSNHSKHVININQLALELAKCKNKQATNKCPECKGSGQKHCDHCGYDHDCKDCDGKGVLPQYDNSVFTPVEFLSFVDDDVDGVVRICVGKSKLSPNNANKLLLTASMLGKRDVDLAIGDELKYIIANIDGIELLLTTLR